MKDKIVWEKFVVVGIQAEKQQHFEVAARDSDFLGESGILEEEVKHQNNWDDQMKRKVK